MDEVEAGLLEVVVVLVQREAVTSELDARVRQRELVENGLGGHRVGVDLVPRLRLGLVVLGNPLEEVLEAALLEEAHERGRKRLGGGGGDLVDLLRVDDVGAGHGDDLEVARDVGVDEHLDEVAGRHHELGAEVDAPMAVVTEVLRDIDFGDALVLLHQVLEVERGRLSAVVGVLVDVENLLAVHGQKGGENALLDAGAKHNDVVLLVHSVNATKQQK